MSSRSSIYNDCCLLANIDLNPERVYHILERRFKSNSNRTSFDFKSFCPEQPSSNAKVSRSLLRFNPAMKTTDDYEENLSSDLSSSEEEEVEEVEEEKDKNDRRKDVFPANKDDDDYLNELAEWKPDDVQPIIEDDDDDDDDDDDEDDDDEDEGENDKMNQSMASPESIQDSHMDMDQMEHLADMSTTQVEDLLITFVHRPVKAEPASYGSHLFLNPPQLDGQIDFLPKNSSSRAKQMDKEERLYNAIAKVKAKMSTPNKAIQLNKLPPAENKFRLNDDRKTKPVPQLPKKAHSTPTKLNQAKEATTKPPKPIKKFKPHLLSTLLRNNEDVIRPLYTQIPLRQTAIQQSSRTSSVSSSRSETHQPSHQRKSSSSSSNELEIPSQQKSNSSSMKKSKDLLQNQRSKFVPNEKSSSEHMTIAERKLNHLKKAQQSQSVPATPSQAKHHVSTGLSSIKSTSSMKNKKSSLKSSKATDSLVRKAESTLKSSVSTQDIIKKKKKKKKKVKRLHSEPADILPNNSSLSEEKTSSKTNNSKTAEHQTIQNQPVNLPQAVAVEKSNKSANEISSRPTNFFDGCIVLDDDDEIHEKSSTNVTDDDDIQEIDRQRYSIAYNIRIREKLLDHAIRSSVMRIKWLFNLECLLLEHILICHEENIRPNNYVYANSLPIKCEYPPAASSYHIDSSFVSIIMINFIKMFVLRNSPTDQQELSFVQFGFTSHLRYLLIELPTYNHSDSIDCRDHCSQYTLIINILFDLLFDLIECDLCEINRTAKYRSTLINDDYFNQLHQSKQTRKFSSYRIKLIVYFIELLGIHMKKCSQRKQFQFDKNENKLFQSMEDFIRHILHQAASNVNERLSICFNVMELCLLFAQEKELRIKQMAVFLTKLCEEKSSCFNVILFNNHLLVDIRLLLINNIIEKRFHLKLINENHLDDFFLRVEVIFDSSSSIDELILVLLRSLFNAYADLVMDIKPLTCMYSNLSQQLTSLLRNELQSIYSKLYRISSSNEEYFKQMKRTLILFRLLQCKWNQL